MIIYSLFHGASGYAILRSTKLKKREPVMIEGKCLILKNADFLLVAGSNFGRTVLAAIKPQL